MSFNCIPYSDSQLEDVMNHNTHLTSNPKDWTFEVIRENNMKSQIEIDCENIKTKKDLIEFLIKYHTGQNPDWYEYVPDHPDKYRDDHYTISGVQKGITKCITDILLNKDRYDLYGLIQCSHDAMIYYLKYNNVISKDINDDTIDLHHEKIFENFIKFKFNEV